MSGNDFPNYFNSISEYIDTLQWLLHLFSPSLSHALSLSHTHSQTYNSHSFSGETLDSFHAWLVTVITLFIYFMVHDLLPFFLLWCNNIFIATNKKKIVTLTLKKRNLSSLCTVVFWYTYVCASLCGHQGWAKYFFFRNWLLFIGIEIQLNWSNPKRCWIGIWIRMSGSENEWIEIQHDTQKINLISISLISRILFN